MNMNLWSNNFHHLSMIPPECHVHVCRSVHAVRSFTHRLPALRKLDLVMRLILRLRLPGKARLGSELESGTGHFSLCNFDTRKIRKGSLRLHDIRMIYATPRFFCCLTSVAPAPARPKYTCSLYNHVLHSP